MIATTNAPATNAADLAFRITFRAEQRNPLQARIIYAATAEEALDKVGPVWSIYRISLAKKGA